MKIRDLVSRPQWAHLTLSLFSYLDLCLLCPSRLLPQNLFLGWLHNCPAVRYSFSYSSCYYAWLIVRYLSALPIRNLHWLCGLSRPPRGSRCSYFVHGLFQLVNLRAVGLASKLKELYCSRRFVINPATFSHESLQYCFDIAESGSPASASGCSSVVHGRLLVNQRIIHGTWLNSRKWSILAFLHLSGIVYQDYYLKNELWGLVSFSCRIGASTWGPQFPPSDYTSYYHLLHSRRRLPRLNYRRLAHGWCRRPMHH